MSAASILKASKRLNLTQPTLTKGLAGRRGDARPAAVRAAQPRARADAYGRSSRACQDRARAARGHAAEELESLRVGYSGKVTVGTLLAASRQHPARCDCAPQDGAARGRHQRRSRHLRHPGASLLVGDLDMVLGRLPEEGRSSALLYEEFYSEPICLVARPGHPLLRKRRLGLRDLANERGCCHYRRPRCAVRSSARSSRRTHRSRET